MPLSGKGAKKPSYAYTASQQTAGPGTCWPRRFDSKEAYIDQMKSAPYITPWLPHIDRHYQYEIEKVKGGYRTNINLNHIQEESGNVRKIDCASLYARVQCPVLILRAPHGLISQDDLLLPEEAIQKMLMMIPNARRFDVLGTNHYGIIFQPHAHRDNAVLRFLSTPFPEESSLPE